jgi:hypothetical protein
VGFRTGGLGTCWKLPASIRNHPDNRKRDGHQSIGNHADHHSTNGQSLPVHMGCGCPTPAPRAAIPMAGQSLTISCRVTKETPNSGMWFPSKCLAPWPYDPNSFYKTSKPQQAFFWKMRLQMPVLTQMAVRSPFLQRRPAQALKPVASWQGAWWRSSPSGRCRCRHRHHLQTHSSWPHRRARQSPARL